MKLWGVAETDVLGTYTELLRKLARLDLAHVRLESTADEELLLELRRIWPNTLILIPGVPGGAKQTTGDDAERWLDRGGDRGHLTYPAYQYTA